MVSVGTSRTFGLNWKLGEKAMLLTPDERVEWVGYAFSIGTKNRFKYFHSQYIKGRMDSTIIEVK